jgi:hypothetical protein
MVIQTYHVHFISQNIILPDKFYRYSLFSQVSPSHPSAQAQEKEAPTSVQVAPFWQGYDIQAREHQE